MKLAVGSTNPVKINAVKEVFSSVYNDFDLISLSVPSGVPDQPFGEETVVGAVNRAIAAKKAANADIGIGIEGGIHKFYDRWYSFGVSVVYDGEIHTGISGWYELPNWVVDKIISNNLELGTVMDMFLNEKDVKRKFGAVSVFSSGLVDRKSLYIHGLTLAVGKWKSKHLFGDINEGNKEDK